MFRYYDENWEPLPISAGPVPGGEGTRPDPMERAAYLLSVQALLDAPSGLGKASVSVSEPEGEMLFSLEVCWQEEVGPIG